MGDEDDLLVLQLDDVRAELAGIRALRQVRHEEVQARVDRVFILLGEVIDRLAAISAQIRVLLGSSDTTDQETDLNALD